MTRRYDIERALRVLAPHIPAYEAEVIVDRALDSVGLRKAVPGEAVWLTLVSYVRHAMTEYDDLLEDGYDQDSARFFVIDTMNEVLAGWGARRTVSDRPVDAPASLDIDPHDSAL